MALDWDELVEDGTFVQDVRGLVAAKAPQILVTVPDHLLEDALERFRAGDSNYGDVLFEVGKAAVELKDWERALWLKRLADAALGTSQRRQAKAVADVLEGPLSDAITLRFTELELPTHGIFNNPPELIDRINERCDTEEEPFPAGRLYASAYRFHMCGMMPYEKQWLLIGSMEHAQFVRFGYRRDADDVFTWIEHHVAQLDVDNLSELERKLVRSVLAACGNAYYSYTEEHHLAARLYEQAIQIGRFSGDELAPDLYYLAMLRQRQGRLQDAHDLLTQILAEPNVTDDELLYLVRQAKSQLEGDLTGNPDRLYVGAAPKLDGFHDPTGVMRLLKELTDKAKRSEPLSDEEIDHAVGVFLQRHPATVSVGANDSVDPIFLTTSASMLFNVLDEEIISKHLPTLIEEFEQVAERIPKTKRRQLSMLLDDLTGNSSRQPRPHTVFYDTEGTPEDRLNLYKSALGQGFSSLSPDGSVGDPTSVLPQMIHDLRLLFAKRVTPDSMKLQLTDTMQLTEFLCASFFVSHGLTPATFIGREGLLQFAREENFLAELPRDESVELLYSYLQTVANWLRLGYREQVFADLWKSEPSEAKRDSFSQQCEEIAAELSKPRDVLFLEELAENRNRCAGIIDRLEVSRNLLISNMPPTVGNEMHALTDFNLLSEGTAVGFLVAFPISKGTRQSPTFGMFLFEVDGLTLWCSQAASYPWQELYEAVAQSQGKADKIHDALSSLRGTNWGDQLHIESSVVAFSDLTRRNTPIGLFEAFDDNPVLVDSRNPCPSPERRNPRLSFWGDLELRSRSQLEVDDDRRVVRVVDEIKYPELSSGAIHDANSERPLRFAAFERWSLEDLEKEGLCSVQCASAGTRADFLNMDWEGIDILHFSTHGEAFATVPDAANLMLAPDHDQSNSRITYNDVLRSDLSRVRLVFLNACLTKYGIQWAGDEDLSLAWAFRAAGAESVIASRWEVPDATCWYFASTFYDALLRSEMTIRTAFGHAVTRTREHDQFSDRAIWGTFSLLE